MSNNNVANKNSDLFNSVIPQMPAANEANNSAVTTATTAQTSSQNPYVVFLQDNFIMLSGILIGIFVVFISLFLVFRKKPKDTQDYRISELVSSTRVKAIKVKQTLATPNTVRQCIKVFLENTKRN